MLAKLKRLLNSPENEDALLTDLISDAKSLVLGYTNRAELTEALESIVVRLAVILYNRRGAEGESGRGEGGISRSFTGEIPDDIKKVLNRFIKARVV